MGRATTRTKTKVSTPARAPALLTDLNPEQRRAVTHATGPLLIVAGAGTGKTTVLTRRIAWLILEQHVPTDGILALTFTEKAATEMEERVDRLLPYGYVDLWVSTFHSFCERILQQHALDIGIPNDFRLLDTTQAWLLLREHLDDLPLDYYRPRGNPTKFLHALLQHFSRCKDEAVTPADYLAYAKNLRLDVDAEHKNRRTTESQHSKRDRVLRSSGAHVLQFDSTDCSRIEEIANAYHAYEQLLLKEGVMDFGDLLLRTLELFRTRPAILERYRRQFTHVLVDEFQDTNWTQYEIVKLLACAEHRAAGRLGANLTVVGDDDQSIYRWRGAAMSNIIHFREDYPNAAQVAITTNYRAKQNLLDAAYASIQQNNPARLEVALGLNKKLRATGKGNGVIEILHAPDAATEARMVVEKIRELYQNDLRAKPSDERMGGRALPGPARGGGERPLQREGGPGGEPGGSPTTWNDFAILVRANRQAEQFLPALSAAGIPYIFHASRGLYRKPIILDLLAYLDLLDDHHESTAFYRVCNMPVFGFSYDELLTLTNWAGRKAQSLYAVARNAAAVPGITPGTVTKAQHVLELLHRHAELARQAPIREVILAFLTDSGYLKAVTAEENAEDHEAVQFLNQFWKRVEAFEAGAASPTLVHFMAMMDLEREAGEEGALPVDPNAGPDAVRVLTVHAAKGLEFRYVFVVNLIEQRFPSVDRGEPIELPTALTKVIVPEGDIHLQEERRLFYVACTRAKEGLWLSYADDYGGTRTRKPSRFILELGVSSSRHSEEPRAAPFRSSAGRRRDEESHKIAGRSNGVRSLASLGMTKEGVSPPTHALPARLSFTQLRAYLTCPWQYHYAHVLRIPLRGRWTLSFGQTMHLTLQRFFEHVLERSSVQQADLFAERNDKFLISNAKTNPNDQIPKLEDLLEMYERAWIDDWYESKRQAKEYFENGKRILKEFYASHDGKWPNVRATEQPFIVKFQQYSVKGKADRIDDLPDGSVEIVDYKTGKPKEKLSSDDKLQLLIYQVAATQVLGVQPKVLSYYYLENNTKTSFLGTNEEIEKLEETIVDVGQNIANGKFEATPGLHCRTCDFRNICPYAR